MTISEPIPLVERSVSDSTSTQPAPQRRSLLPQISCTDNMMMGVALLAGPANVIMQLARPGVGYGVLESRVESGRVDLHPIKRARTTFTYLVVATQGSDQQKTAFREAVNSAHRQVRSTADSPVKYNAFDRDLQLWVGACLYKGNVDVHRIFLGEMDDEHADRHYHNEGKAMATMLQVPEDMWPPDRAAFDRYWQEQLDKVHIDDTVREYLLPIAASRLRGMTLPGPLQRANERLALLITTGFLPQRFRDEMQLPWDADKQRQFDRLMSVIRGVNNLLPKFLRGFPFNVLLWDVDRRIRTGRPLV
ncbi:oxygenase MpaB family protein [Mycobacterium sp. pW045]|uniref:oxygenase MpaB family protein n=1 Tax=Mycobacterium sp. pW045 TaxID=3238984 RepID=UPI00351B94F7